jgi:signal transduction histidine kinase/ActR/RegA family two-component response regulator/HPt (histidine-containing phosphotransfer) domain-containing protein
MVANLRDLTEGLEARVAERTAEIKESERRLSDIVDFLPHATFVINRSGKVIAWNHAIEQMTGIRAEEMLGKGDYAYAIPFYGERRPILIDLVLDQLEGHDKHYANLKREGQVLTGESFLPLASGGRFYAVASASALYDEQGKVAGAIEIIRDETERKALETELLEAKEKAEEATRAKSNFLANMSHEIRTPMNAIIGFIELSLEDSRLPKNLRSHMETAFRSARSLLALINDILDVSKVESGKLDLEIRPFRLQAMLQDVIKVMRVKAEEKGLALDLVLPPEVDKAYSGDAFRIRQVLMNLVGNAVKFTERGEITVSVEPYGGEGELLHFKVADTGIGIPADRIDKVFESFTQADGSISRRYGGTGLGTTISRQLVELMGGRIWAESAHGKGSVFQFTLPLKPAAADFQDVEAITGSEEMSGPTRCFRVLLAEDVEENITLARHRLEKRGHTVTVARNGREAVAAIEKGGIDIVLMDVQMPEMDGLEATRRIRQMETGGSVRTPVIALTASVMKTDRSQCMESGMDMIVGKPVNFPRLFAAMEKLVPPGAGHECVPPENGIPKEADFPGLAGIDTGRGLETWGDRAAYATALQAFARNHGDAADRIAAALSAGDVPRAIQEAHKLKGIAGNLALTAVSSVVEALYLALHEKNIAQARELTAPLANAVAEVAAAIRGLSTSAEEAAPEPKSFDRQQVATLLQDLRRDLKKSNPYAVEPLVDRLREYLSAEQLEPVTAKIDQFDFPGAEEAVVRIAGNLNVHLGA